MRNQHYPVLWREVLAYLQPQPGKVYLDCTVGGGGHARHILEISNPSGGLVGIDLDQTALEIAREYLSPFGERVALIQGNFEDIEGVLAKVGLSEVHGVLLDLGVSAFQLRAPERGFSFRDNGPLDMRMDRSKKLTAAELLNTLPEREIKELIFRYGEEKWSGRIARDICRIRTCKPLTNTRELADIVTDAIPRSCHPRKIHPATRTFQALRIAVNGELEGLVHALEKTVKILKTSGRVCAISFHSLEDRLVKQTFRKLDRGCICPPSLPTCICGKKTQLKTLTRHPVTPSTEEIAENPPSRSAKLRVAEKLAL